MEFITVNTRDIVGCHPKYHDLFVAKNIDQLQGFKNSIMKDGKINPIHLMNKDDGDRLGLYIVDGLSTYTVCESSGTHRGRVHPAQGQSRATGGAAGRGAGEGRCAALCGQGGEWLHGAPAASNA